MILGTLFGIPQMTAAIIAIASGRSPFTASREMRDKVKASMRSFCGWSDVVAGLRALTEFEKVYRERGEEEAQAWADHFYLNFFRMMNLSRVKYQLLVDVQRSGLLGAAATEGVNPEEWGWGNGEEGEWEEEGAEGEPKEGEEGEGGVEGEEEEEQQEEEAEVDEEEAAADKAAQESAGATFEGSEVGAGMERSEWLEELKTTSREVQDERLLVAILCAAYPYNLAYRHKPDHQNHKTPSAQKASFDSRSVNATKKDENSEVTVDGPSWWLYSDMRMFNGKTQLVDTTLLSEWDVALFGGLRSKNGEEGKLELDNWINVSAENEKTEELLMKLRDELRKAPIWLSIAASWDKIATAATLRSQTLFSILGSVLMKQEPNAETIELMRKFKMPEVEEGLHAHLQAKEEDREDIEERLRKKTVPELKVLLREMDVKDTGKKADLVTRTATALIYGKEEAEKEPDWGSWGGEGEEGEGEGEGEGEEGRGNQAGAVQHKSAARLRLEERAAAAAAAEVAACLPFKLRQSLNKASVVYGEFPPPRTEGQQRHHRRIRPALYAAGEHGARQQSESSLSYAFPTQSVLSGRGDALSALSGRVESSTPFSAQVALEPAAPVSVPSGGVDGRRSSIDAEDEFRDWSTCFTLFSAEAEVGETDQFDQHGQLARRVLDEAVLYAVEQHSLPDDEDAASECSAMSYWAGSDGADEREAEDLSPRVLEHFYADIAAADGAAQEQHQEAVPQLLHGQGGHLPPTLQSRRAWAGPGDGVVNRAMPSLDELLCSPRPPKPAMPRPGGKVNPRLKLTRLGDPPPHLPAPPLSARW